MTDERVRLNERAERLNDYSQYAPYLRGMIVRHHQLAAVMNDRDDGMELKQKSQISHDPFCRT